MKPSLHELWNGLTDPRLASAVEVGELVAYLRTTDTVRALGNWIAEGLFRVWNAQVPSRGVLGSLLTCFGNLSARCWAREITGRDKFLVREVSEILHRTECEDLARARLDNLIAAVTQGRLEDRRITAVISPWGPMLAYGNKRASAIYETSANRPDLVLLIVVLEHRDGPYSI